MNTLKYLFIVLLAFFSSCSSNDSETTNDELAGLALVRKMENETHIVELYSSTGILEQGHNAISIRIKNKTTEKYEHNAIISWTPLMHMTSMQHSCPFSPVSKTVGKETLYNGYTVFQMPQNDTEYWTLKIDYSINGVNFSATDTIDVPASAKRRVTSFIGSDGSNYIVALISPSDPHVALNAMTAGVFKMQSIMHYPIADNYSVKIDPRMPSMGNHASPNNQDLIQSPDKLYRGKLSLTMTGYWKINLQLLGANNEVLKGEAVTATNPQSSIFFEIEF